MDEEITPKQIQRLYFSSPLHKTLDVHTMCTVFPTINITIPSVLDRVHPIPHIPLKCVYGKGTLVCKCTAPTSDGEFPQVPAYVELFDERDYKGRLSSIYYKEVYQKILDKYDIDYEPHTAIHRDLKLLSVCFYRRKKQFNHKEIELNGKAFLVQKPTKFYYDNQLLISPHYLKHRTKDKYYKNLLWVSQDAEETYYNPYLMMEVVEYLRKVIKKELTELKDGIYLNETVYFTEMLIYMEKYAPLNSFVSQNVYDTSSDSEMAHLQFVPQLYLPLFKVDEARQVKWYLPVLYFCFGMGMGKKQFDFVDKLSNFCAVFAKENEVTFTPFARKDENEFLELYLVVKKSAEKLKREYGDGEILKARPGWYESAGGFINNDGIQSNFFNKCGAEKYYSYYGAEEQIVQKLFKEVTKLKNNESLDYVVLEKFEGGTPASILKVKSKNGKVFIHKSCTSNADNGMISLIKQSKFIAMMNKRKKTNLYPQIYNIEIGPNYASYDMEYIGPSLSEALERNLINIEELKQGIDSLLRKIWNLIKENIIILNTDESIQQFNKYYGRVLQRIEEAKRDSEDIKHFIQMPFFEINDIKVPNVYHKVIKLFQHNITTFYPQFIVPFIHRDTNPENILIREDNGKLNKEDYILIDVSGDCLDDSGNVSYQELAPDFGKLCFGFGGYSSIINEDFQLEEKDGKVSLSFGKRTNVQLMFELLYFYEQHEITKELMKIEPMIFKRVKFNIIVSFLADLKYRKTVKGRLANLFQASYLAHKMQLF